MGETIKSASTVTVSATYITILSRGNQEPVYLLRSCAFEEDLQKFENFPSEWKEFYVGYSNSIVHIKFERRIQIPLIHVQLGREERPDSREVHRKLKGNCGPASWSQNCCKQLLPGFRQIPHNICFIRNKGGFHSPKHLRVGKTCMRGLLLYILQRKLKMILSGTVLKNFAVITRRLNKTLHSRSRRTESHIQKHISPKKMKSGYRRCINWGGV